MAGVERDPGGVPTLQIEGRIATIALQRPAQANRLEPEDLHALLAHIDAVDARPEVLVLRLVASGRSFCAGFNLNRMAGEGGEAGRLFEQLADAIEATRPVTIAALQGGVYGGATDLALACDFRLGAAGCEWQVPAARLGLHYYRGGLERYVALLGPDLTRRVMLLAERFDGPAMLAAGMLHRLLADPQELVRELDRMSAELAAMGPLALLPMKRHISAMARGRLDAGRIAQDIARAQASEDLREGSRAWQEKRPARFHGR
ncbi:enoyl-CoA hydratase/isomerase family protein [Ramlibacter sp. G-1-2-2]|uniref:Enoyl-CoA hydratase/isomerase family protein n=1 Tax=Ramlibacter agri TaxID=2728837 RepID=A0A848HAU7_9BURK|nr:enoyl-CoA hydratase/isomerase family protein [Ramlibacter agri]NML44728.1 enoyl-CoA hydratase/isomerase family protein [Ramlibacter agri]